MSEKLPAGLPGFQEAPCLGCGRPVFESEQFSKVMGTRSASYLLVQVAEEHAWQTSSGPKPGETLELLGVAFPEVLPTLEFEQG